MLRLAQQLAAAIDATALFPFASLFQGRVLKHKLARSLLRLISDFRPTYALSRSTGTRSHIAPVLAADLKQRIGDLPQRADPHRVHQHLEHVVVLNHRLLQAFEHGW